MKIRKIIKKEKFENYELRHEVIDGSEYNGADVTLISAYNNNGDYIGNKEVAASLDERGIMPEIADKENSVCSIGFSKKKQKWFGWSHRAMFGFKIGHIVKEGNCESTSGWTEEYLKTHKDDLPMPIGFEVKNLEDAKRCAIAFANSVS